MTLELINPTLVGGGAAAMIFAGVIFFLIVGRRVGQKAFERQGGGQANVGSLEAAVFALLGLLIAFTFSGALQRFDTRRVQVVEEANTVGTAWMRLDLLPAAARLTGPAAILQASSIQASREPWPTGKRLPAPTTIAHCASGFGFSPARR